jgi:Uma2 family endonuclease
VNRRREWNITVLPEIRIRVGATRFRIPDIAIILGDTDEKIPTKPLFLCIEILSPDDRWSRVEGRISDFLKMGHRSRDATDQCGYA